MKNKKLLVVLIALVMVMSVIFSAYIPVADAVLSNSTEINQANSGLVDVTGNYSRVFDESLFADGVLTTAEDMAALTESSDTFSANEEVWVIIELKGNSLLSQYNEVRFNDYTSLNEYVLSYEAQADASSMLVQQNTLIKALDRAGISVEYKYAYTSVINGFAAKVRYGDIAEIEAYSAVEDVIVSEKYNMPESAVVNEVDVYETGIFNSSDSPYQGEGMVVAVLDTGIEYGHEVFDQDLSGVDNRMDEEYISERIPTLNAYSIMNGSLAVEDVYYSDKIPFSFDYSDKDTNATPSNNPHGVHVSGIITGLSDTITGVAPKAQLLGMKVFSDFHSGAYTIDILAALEDCILLNVDVINMSLGSDCGFQTVPEGNRIGILYDELRTAGITMMVAAGNSYNAAMGSAFGSTALTQNPDYGVMSSPASYSTTTAVASINGTKDEYISANDGETIAFFDNASNAASREYDFYDMLEGKLKSRPDLPQFENGRVTLDYITVPGLGYLYNYGGIDVTDKVVLVARGVCTFQEKALAANTVGALAIIIYNNTTGVIRMSIGNELDIPACSINKTAGDAMAKHATGTVTLDRNNLAGPFMSGFSSWGSLPNLNLDPDISGHGGNILSSVTGNQYAVYSGTSMATPNLAGVALLVRQYLHATHPELSKADITGLTNQILMSTSTIAKDDTNKPVSPRKQGSGLAYLEAALNTQAYLTVDGSEFTKLSLGDDPDKTGVYELNFNLVNWGTSALSYKFSVDVMSECFSWVKDYEKWAIDEEAYLFTDSNVQLSITNGTYVGDIVTVNGGQTAQIKVTITLSEEAKAYLNQVDEEGDVIFENGTYVEGFVRLEAQDANSYDLSLPYMAFYGDWLDAPMFDYDYYDVKASENDPTLTEEEWLKATTYNTTPMAAYYLDTRTYSESYNKNTYLLPLGTYLWTVPAGETPINPDPELAAISMYTTKTYGLYNVYLGLLRSVKTMTMTISDYYTGKVIKETVYNNIRKSIGARPSFVYDAVAWDKENDPEIFESMLYYPYGEGDESNRRYKVDLVGTIDYENGDQVTNNTYSFSFYTDYENPVVTDIQYRMKENKNNIEEPYTYYADITVYDNHYAQCIMIGYIPEGGTQIHTIGSPTPVRGERNSSTTVEVNITEYVEHADQYDSLFVIVNDYAVNEGYYRVTLPRNITDLAVKEEDKSITINKYQTYTVTPMVTPADQWASGLVWTSSDESVAIVSNEGVIYGVGEGECIITITDKDLEKILSPEEYESYQYYKDLGYPEYFKIFGEEGEVLFSGAQHWDGKVEIAVRVENPENNRYKEVIPTKLEVEGFNYVRAFDRDLFGVNFKLETVRNIGSSDVYPSEKISIKLKTEPWNVDLNKYAFVWSSANESIATVSEQGVVTALKKGTVTITVKLLNLETQRTPVSTSVLLEVSDPFVISNYVLTKYYGAGDENGVVELPTDQYYTAIDEFAFCYSISDRSDEYNEETNYQHYVGNSYVKKVIIPEGIETIGAYAFYNCTALEEVVLPTVITEGVTKYLSNIETGAFYNCTNLKTINMGSGKNNAPVSYVGAYAFYNCSSLRAVDLSTVTWIRNGAFIGCSNITKVELPLLRMSGAGVFQNCDKLTEVVFSEKTVIGKQMFEGCDGLTSVTIPMKSVADAAFFNCSKLRTVRFTGAINYIGTQAFANCKELNAVSFSDQAVLGEIGIAPFMNSTSLTKFDLNANNSNLTSENNGAIILDSTGEKFVLIAPAYNMATYRWENSNVKVIGSGVFAGRNDYRSTLDLSKSKIEVIEEYAFRLSPITGIVFPSTLKTIEQFAFAGCTTLSSVEIPAGVEVGRYAFAQCYLVQNGYLRSGLQTVTLNSDVVLHEGAFYTNPYLQSVTLPTDKSVELAGQGIFMQCENLKTIDLTQFEAIPDYTFALCLKLNDLDFSQTKKIGAYSFLGNGYTTALESVDLSNVEEIGARAFYGAIGLKKVVLGENLKVVSEYAFALCVNLTEINLNYVEEIGNGAFFYNIGNSEIVGGSYIQVGDTYTYGIQNISLDNCKKIGLGAFSNCPWIETVYAPVVEEIGDAAFNPTQGVDDPEQPKQYVYQTSLKSVDLGTAERDVVIGAGAFVFATKLATINGFENVSTVGSMAFARCDILTGLDMSGLETVDEGAFQYCLAFTEIDAPNLKVVGDYAFSYCENLTAIAISNEAESIGEFAFAYTAISEFKFASTLTFIGQAAFYAVDELNAFTGVALNNLGREVIVDTFAINEKYFVEDGMLYGVTAYGDYELLAIPANKTGDIVAIKEGTIRIAYGAGYGNKGIKQLELPMSLKVIGANAFDKANIKVVVFQALRAPQMETEFPQYIYYSVHSIPEFAQPSENVVSYYAALGIQVYYRYYNFNWMALDEENLEMYLVENAPMAVYPTNGVGYNNWIFQLMFKLRTEGEATLGDEGILAKQLMTDLPSSIQVKLEHGDAIRAARAAYDAVPDVTQKNLLSTLYSKLVAAEKRLAQLEGAGSVTPPPGGGDNTGDNQGQQPGGDNTGTGDGDVDTDTDYKQLYEDSINANKKLTTTAWILGIVAVLAVAGLALYVFVFSKKQN